MKQSLSIILEIIWKYCSILCSTLLSTSKLDNELISELRSSAKKSSKSSVDSNSEWQSNLDVIYSNILNKDPRFFLTWPVIRQTMFMNYSMIVERELEALKQSYWLKHIREDWFGFPLPFLTKINSSANSIHLAYHLHAYEKKTKQTISKMNVILEFGGGYGCLCKLIFRSGFKGTYIIFDFPLFSALQTFYLRKLGYSVSNSPNKMSTIYCLSSTDDVKKVLRKFDADSKSLFIATWSLSESPLTIRNKFVPLLENFNHLLIAYQKNFGSVNNIQYFSKFMASTDSHQLQQYHLKLIPNSYYLFGY